LPETEQSERRKPDGFAKQEAGTPKWKFLSNLNGLKRHYPAAKHAETKIFMYCQLNFNMLKFNVLWANWQIAPLVST